MNEQGLFLFLSELVDLLSNLSENSSLIVSHKGS